MGIWIKGQMCGCVGCIHMPRGVPFNSSRLESFASMVKLDGLSTLDALPDMFIWECLSTNIQVAAWS